MSICVCSMVLLCACLLVNSELFSPHVVCLDYNSMYMTLNYSYMYSLLPSFAEIVYASELIK